jgi:hypothetical protein
MHIYIPLPHSGQHLDKGLQPDYQTLGHLSRNVDLRSELDKQDIHYFWVTVYIMPQSTWISNFTTHM